jgi:hypothetical protein
MQTHSVEEMSERFDTHWRLRVARLELLVAELSAKNQHMRFNLQAIEQNKPTSETVALN